jgi:hypothetical protein
VQDPSSTAKPENWLRARLQRDGEACGDAYGSESAGDVVILEEIWQICRPLPRPVDVKVALDTLWK